MNVISGELSEITKDQAEAMPMSDAWKDESIPYQQLNLTNREVAAWLAGQSVAPFDVIRESLSGLSGSLLEIGCGVGHYNRVIRECGDFQYFGVDYSELAIALAMDDCFHVMDASQLDFSDNSFDIVISGCVLLHIVDWRTALKESARVARQYLILHRTPVSDEPTRYFHKKAYGVDCVEIHFNRAEIVVEAESHGFTLKKTFPVTKGQETLLFERSLFHHPV
jgi:SAM-dependent methyltransferase